MLLTRTSRQNTFAPGLVDVSLNAAIQTMFAKSFATEAHVAAAERPYLMRFPVVAVELFFSRL
jgi:hypothetical protein